MEAKNEQCRIHSVYESVGTSRCAIQRDFCVRGCDVPSTGLLARTGQVDLLVGLVGCTLGIFVSDLGLWFLGRGLRRRALSWNWLQRRLSEGRLKQWEKWFDQRSWRILLAARFLPGTRVPCYVAAGMLGQRLGHFAFWTFLAALVWTPLLIVGVALFGQAVVRPLSLLVGPGWLAGVLAVLVLFMVVRTVITACTPIGRSRLWSRISRLWRWEFWPSWLFYLPVLPWLLYLSIRYRGFMTWTAANPGMPHGGVVGESKHEILAQLPERWVVPSLFVPPGDMEGRLAEVRTSLAEKAWQFPLILKPDASQRGAGLKLARDLVDVEKYLQNQPAAVILQTYHPGPHEAGVFYYLFPAESTGHIFSITDKQFPEITGDGSSTLEELIWGHPRFRMQAGRFLARHEADRNRVLAEGERFRLAIAGNHCQGTMFRDGAHLITPELEHAVDVVARKFNGFFIGRFDVRYANVFEFKAGRDLSIVELNGATSESTNIYDPSWSLFSAYRTLFQQWSLLYRIGYANRHAGYRSTSTLALLRLVFD